MTDMIEKVAHQTIEAVGDAIGHTVMCAANFRVKKTNKRFHCHCGADEKARAAILATLEALMEPTAGMVKAGVMAMSATMSHGEPESAVIYGQPKDVLQAMLREAIAELK